MGHSCHALPSPAYIFRALKCTSSPLRCPIFWGGGRILWQPDSLGLFDFQGFPWLFILLLKRQSLPQPRPPVLGAGGDPTPGRASMPSPHPLALVPELEAPAAWTIVPQASLPVDFPGSPVSCLVLPVSGVLLRRPAPFHLLRQTTPATVSLSGLFSAFPQTSQERGAKGPREPSFDATASHVSHPSQPPSAPAKPRASLSEAPVDLLASLHLHRHQHVQATLAP